MAAKEKKSTVAKHLKDNQADKEKLPETPKGKRGRKSNASIENKLSAEQKTPVGRKKRKSNVQDGRSTPVLKRPRRSVLEPEDPGTAKTPPPPSQKFKKAHLEKELGDLLENATGRNTPLLPRNKKINEKEEESGENTDDKLFGKSKKGIEKDADDDNISVKSFTTLLRARKNVDKEVDDDVLSVRSMNVRLRKTDPSEDDSSSVRSLTRPNVGRPGRKKKSVLTAIAVKKKIFIRRGRPKKIKDVNDVKGKLLEEKKVGKMKLDKNAVESKQKRIIKKPLKFQSKIKDQTKLRSNLAIKNQKLKKTKLKLSDKTQSCKNKEETEISKDVVLDRERLKSDSQTLAIAKSDVSDEDNESDSPPRKKKLGPRKKKVKEDDRNEDSESENVHKPNDIYFFSDLEYSAGQDSTGRGRSCKLKYNHQKKKLGLRKNLDGRKKRRESGIHFETTRSPDDSSVMIVHPRLGPKIKGSKRLKPILPKTDEVKRTKNTMTQDLVPANVLPNPLSMAVPNYNQISSSYFVQSIPNFNLFAANPTIIRSYSKSNPSSNIDSNLPVASTNVPFVEDINFPVSQFGSKVSSNEIIVTPSGIVLSGNRIVSPGSQHPPAVCFNGPNSNFGSEGSNGDISFSSQESLNGVPSSGVIYQSGTAVIQPSSNSNCNTTIFLKRPEAMSTSLISTTSGSVVVNPSANSNSGLKANNVKSHCNNSTDTIASEKALEGDFQGSGETSTNNRFKNISKLDFIPSIPVAKNVNDLLMLKNKSNVETRLSEEENRSNKSNFHEKLDGKPCLGVPNILRETNSVLVDENFTLGKSNRKTRKRTLKNVRHFKGSSSELTFSEPEMSNCENEEMDLSKAVSCERMNKSSQILEPTPKFLLQLGSAPITISESLAPYETASVLLVTKKEKLEGKLEKDGLDILECSVVKEAVQVCKFSKENEEALKELGLDSDLEQSKSEVEGDSPVKNERLEESGKVVTSEMLETSKKAKIKEEMDNILKEMPVRKLSNYCRKPESFNISSNRVEIKNPLVLKNNDYLTISPSKPPTVIDKLLERNKSLKKAEQEGKYQSVVRNLSENSVNCELVEVKPRKNTRELRARKFVKGMESRRTAHKKFLHGTSGCKIYERRGSNPEIYSNNYLTVKNQVANENVPLRRVTDPGDGKYQRRGSIDYETIQKVLDRRCSLPTGTAELSHSKTMESLNKTEKIKTILVGSSKPLASKNRASDVQPRVINIVTSNCGLKKGKNLMEEIGLEIGSGEESYENGDKNGRRISVESSNSETENLQKLMDGLADVNDKLSNEVPYFGEKSSRREEKERLSIGEKSIEDNAKKNVVIEESPEDLLTKETILSALGMYEVFFMFLSLRCERVPVYINFSVLVNSYLQKHRLHSLSDRLSVLSCYSVLPRALLHHIYFQTQFYVNKLNEIYSTYLGSLALLILSSTFSYYLQYSVSK